MDNKKKHMGDQSNDHAHTAGIIRIPQLLRHQSRRHILGDATTRLHVDDPEASRTTKGTQMKMPNTREQTIGGIAYAAGYFFAAATLVKFAWWIWSQPW